MAKKKRTDGDLRRAARHVAHDIRMLARAFDGRRDPFAYTAWFVHCRSVMEFFRETTENSDDIIVSDFLPQAITWSSLVQDTHEPADYGNTKTAVNKLAAHLTFGRLEYEKGGKEKEVVPSEEITNYLLGLAYLFVDALPPQRRLWFGGRRVWFGGLWR